MSSDELKRPTDHPTTCQCERCGPTLRRYTDDLRLAYDAAAQWVDARPGLPLTFLEPADALVCSLDVVADQWAGGDTDARAFLQVMIDATDGRCTYLQAKFVMRHVLAEGSPGGSA